jgi:hypothetical protein
MIEPHDFVMRFWPIMQLSEVLTKILYADVPTLQRFVLAFHFLIGHPIKTQLLPDFL